MLAERGVEGLVVDRRVVRAEGSRGGMVVLDCAGGIVVVMAASFLVRVMKIGGIGEDGFCFGISNST